MRKPVERPESEPRPDYLARVARNLADAHGVASLTRARTRHPLPTRSFESQFARIFAELSELDSAALDRLPGVEWLLDNDYVVHEAIVVLQDNAPDDGYRRLPALATAPRRGELRVLALADEILNVCGTPVDIDWVQWFIIAYQADAALSLGELWALPSMLRNVALERLANATRTVLTTVRDASAAPSDYSEAIASQIQNLRSFAAQDWNVFVESVSKVHEILTDDPAGAYERMDLATRNRYQPSGRDPGPSHRARGERCRAPRRRPRSTP